MKSIFIFILSLNLFAQLSTKIEIPTNEWTNYSNQITSVQAGVTESLYIKKEKNVVQAEVLFVDENTNIIPGQVYNHIIIQPEHFEESITTEKDELGQDVVLKLSREEHYVGQKAYRLIYTNIPGH